MNLFNTNKNNINYKKLEDKIKLDLVFNFLGEKDQSINDKYNNLAKNVNFINSIKINSINDKFDFVNSILNDLAKLTE